MRLWAYQKYDFGTDYWRQNGGTFRIYRLAVWRWAWIWGKHIKPAPQLPPQAHSKAAEIAYMRQHPEIWPPDEDYSAVYAEHHLAAEKTSSWEVRQAAKELKEENQQCRS